MGPSPDTATNRTSKIVDLFFLLRGSNTRISALLLPTSLTRYLLKAGRLGPSGQQL